MTWVVAADHAAIELKNALATLLRERGYAVITMGPKTADTKADYPLVADALAAELLAGRAEFGLLLCGTGIGMSIRANRYPGIRAALAHNAETARLAREHNNANVLCLGGRVLSATEGEAALTAFLDAKFEGGRHAHRVEMLDAPLPHEQKQKGA